MRNSNVFFAKEEARGEERERKRREEGERERKEGKGKKNRERGEGEILCYVHYGHKRFSCFARVCASNCVSSALLNPHIDDWVVEEGVYSS